MPNNRVSSDEAFGDPCIICGSLQFSVLVPGDGSARSLRSLICCDCGLVWLNPLPHEPRRFYESDYRLKYKKAFVPKIKRVYRAGCVALGRYAKVAELFASRRAVLDVGTGGGEFAYLLKSLGHDLAGVEPNKGYAEYSIQKYDLDLQVGFVQDCNYAPESFDVITMWHVLEHTEDPLVVLQRLQSLLKSRGTLVVEVPNIEAVCQAPASTFHEAHLFHFNVSTLVMLGEKAGLHLQKYLYSDDLGNITVFFQKACIDSLECSESKVWTIAGNAEHISSIIKGRSSLRHYLSATPYKRLWQRISRTVFEKIKVRACLDSKQLLDELYRNYL